MQDIFYPVGYFLVIGVSSDFERHFTNSFKVFEWYYLTRIIYPPSDAVLSKG